jgi:tripartite ATP-independent transporter DctM subunit
MVIAIGVFLLTLLLGIPIAFTVGLSGLAHISALAMDNLGGVVIQRMFSGVNSFSLMCIPFFILAGELMNRSGITRHLIDFARECVGFLRGGLAYVVVLVAILLSAILGSANAVAAILCTALIPELTKDGYEKDFSASLIAASGCLGPIVPPSVSFILFGVLTGASINKLFVAGIIPGILIGIGYMGVIYWYARKRDYPKSKEKFEFNQFIKAFIKALPSLIIPLVIVGGILGGVFTPTESGAVAVLIAFIAGLCYRTLKLSDLPKILVNTAVVTAGIMVIVAFGNILGWTLAIDKVPIKLSAWILSITTNPNMVMLLLIIVLIFIGCVLEGFAAILIFAPVFAPLATSVGIDITHFGMVFTVLLSLGLVTPPMGMVLFVSSNIAGVPLTKMNKSIIPFVIVAFLVSGIIAFFPQVTMYMTNFVK